MARTRLPAPARPPLRPRAGDPIPAASTLPSAARTVAVPLHEPSCALLGFPQEGLHRHVETLVVEIRPGEGGDDAVTFAEELADAFAAYTRRNNGTATVATGRRQTSTATVAVLEDGDTAGTSAGADWNDIDLDVYSGSGPGGQHRNKTEQCARLTHRPTGLVVVATAARSQRQNIQAAFTELQRRLGAAATEAAEAARNQARRAQIVTGERPQKQWTWNDQRAEVVDHSTGARYPMAAFRRGRFTVGRR